MATEEQTQFNNNTPIGLTGNTTRNGQLLTITDRYVSKLGFWLHKDGSPVGDVTFKIFAANDDEVLASKVLFDASALTVSATFYEVTFASPVYINEQVRIAAVKDTDISGSNYIRISYNIGGVKSGEQYTQYIGSWSNQVNNDMAYIYTYSGSSTSSVTTQAMTVIASTTATGNGNVTGLGVPAATQHGHCWSINHLPTVSDSKTTNGVPSAGAYTSSLTGLTVGTKYYVRAYIQGPWGTLYGAEVAFTTLGNEPSVSIQVTTAIAATTATGNGNVLALGSPAPTQYGHCWDVIPSPTVVDSGNGFWGKTSKGVPGATGAYTSSLTVLEQNTLYYMRAYITDSFGVTFYSSQQASFTTLVGVPLGTTDEASEVTETTALGNGSIYNDGGASITQHGVVWDTNANPTIALATRTEEGVGVVGDFSSLMDGLTANTLYYYRVYATNSEGTGYGEDKTFTTNITGAPTVTSEDPADLQEATVTGNGTIVGIGGSSVTEHGHCWSTSPNPTTADSKTTNGAASAGAFTSAITGLTQNTRYYYRAYATNTQGTGYGNNVTFVMGFAFPVDTVSRVSGIKRTFWAGAAGSPGVYLAELFLGGLSTTYISPIGDREPVPSVPSTRTPAQTPTPVSGQGFQLSDYARWLSENTAFNIIRVFGHQPSFAEWIEYQRSR